MPKINELYWKYRMQQKVEIVEGSLNECVNSQRNARKRILASIAQNGLIPPTTDSNTHLLLSADGHISSRISYNLVQLAKSKGNNFSKICDYAIQDPHCGMIGITLERNYTIKAKDVTELTPILAPRLLNSILFIVVGEQLKTRRSQYSGDVSEQELEGSIGHDAIQAIIVPNFLYAEVVNLYKDVTIIPVDTVNCTIKLSKHVVKNIQLENTDAIDREIDKKFPLMKLQHPDFYADKRQLLQLVEFEMTMPDYSAGLLQYIENSIKKYGNSHFFGLHLTRLPTQHDVSMLLQKKENSPEEMITNDRQNENKVESQIANEIAVTPAIPQIDLFSLNFLTRMAQKTTADPALSDEEPTAYTCP